LHTATGRRDRTLLAVRDRPQALATDAVRGKIVAHRLSAASTKRDVILAGAALIRMAFNSERVLAVSLEPLCLLVQRRDGLRGEFRRIRFEEDSIAYSNYEIRSTLFLVLRRSRRNRAHAKSVVWGLARTRDHVRRDDAQNSFQRRE
jgi:hypothetical protein